MKRILMLAAMAAGIGGNSARAADRPLWLVVTTEQLAPSIQPLADRRRTEGLDAVVVTEDPASALKRHPQPAYLLLVGDVPGPSETPDAAWHVPALELPLYRWAERQRLTFASDSKWGELDGDELPDVPVGRIPARTPEEAAAVVAKIIAYEDRPWTVDDLRFPMWLGSPNFGPAIDALATTMMMTILQTNMPRWGEPSAIVAIPSSPYCGWPAEHAATFDGWMRRGGMCALVGAHGGETYVFSMTTGDEWYGYQVSDIERDFAEGPPTCPIVLLSCLTGGFAGDERCLTEALVLAPGGPVAAAGATTESHGLTNSLHGLAMARGFDAEPQRLGDFWLAGLRASHAERHPLLEVALLNVEGSIDGSVDVEQLRRDQVWMYALMGDPATKIRAPGRLNATMTRVGDQWQWTVEPPAGAEKLQAAFRPAIQSPPAVPAEMDQAAARNLQDEANAIFAYESLAALPTGAAWQGEVSQPGEVRLVAIGADRWWVAVLKVE